MHSTPPTNTPVNPTRRSVLSLAAGSLAAAIPTAALAADNPDAEIIAAGAKFEELFSKWTDIRFVWAKLMRTAHEMRRAKFGEKYLLSDAHPACRYLAEITEQSGCRAADDAISVYYDEMDQLAELIRDTPITTIAALHAKVIVSIWNCWPCSALHDGCLTYLDEDSHLSLLNAAIDLTGLSDMVTRIEDRLEADVVQS